MAASGSATLLSVAAVAGANTPASPAGADAGAGAPGGAPGAAPAAAPGAAPAAAAASASADADVSADAGSVVYATVLEDNGSNNSNTLHNNSLAGVYTVADPRQPALYAINSKDCSLVVNNPSTSSNN